MKYKRLYEYPDGNANDMRENLTFSLNHLYFWTPSDQISSALLTNICKMDDSQKQLWSSYVNSVRRSVTENIHMLAVRIGLTSSLRRKRDALADDAILTNKHRVVLAKNVCRLTK